MYCKPGHKETNLDILSREQYFGGISSAMASSNDTRFLDDLTVMGCLDIWPYFTGRKLTPATLQAIPGDMIFKFFSESFWHHDMIKWGHQAMKIWPREVPRMSAKWDDFQWSYVERKFGRPVRRWMEAVYDRTWDDDEHGLVWRWLYFQTVSAVEPVVLLIRWRKHHSTWKATDKVLWTKRNDCSNRAADALAYLQQLLAEVNAWDGVSQLPAPRVEPFRDCLGAMQDMHRILAVEAGYYQIFAVDYHKQTDMTVKNDIQRLFGTRLHARLRSIHMAISNDCIQFLDDFVNIDWRVTNRLATNLQLVDLLTTGREQLRASFSALRQVLTPILASFGPGHVDFVFKREDFPGVASGSTIDLAKSIEKLARRQFTRLTGPPRTIAQGWLSLLNSGGDIYRSPAPGTTEAAANQGLSSVADFIDGLTQAQVQAVAVQHPVQAQAQSVQQPVLQNNQPQRGEFRLGTIVLHE